MRNTTEVVPLFLESFLPEVHQILVAKLFGYKDTINFRDLYSDCVNKGLEALTNFLKKVLRKSGPKMVTITHKV